MGVVNLTPDSFSDGGCFVEPDRAVEHGLALVAEGADLLDLGAESTRPGGGVYGSGARAVPAEEELARLLPVLERLRRETAVPISVDTRKARVARAALAAGADLVNDVSALGDPGMAEVVREAGCPIILMHSRGDLATMQREIHYGDAVRDIRDDLARSLAKARAAGLEPDRLWIDPGIGFGKTYEHNVQILARLDELSALGQPLVIGASRKSFIGHLTGGVPPGERLAGSLAAVAWAARHRAAQPGAVVVRVHDVLETVRFLRVWNAIEGERRGEHA